MKIDRKKFTQAMSYIIVINHTDFDSLDFSEFFDVNDPEYEEMRDQFKLLGLSNRDFITMHQDKWL